MRIDNQFLERVRKVSENYFLDFYFLNVDISLIMHDPSLILFICIDYITVEGNVSQIFDIGPGSFFIKS